MKSRIINANGARRLEIESGTWSGSILMREGQSPSEALREAAADYHARAADLTRRGDRLDRAAETLSAQHAQ